MLISVLSCKNRNTDENIIFCGKDTISNQLNKQNELLQLENIFDIEYIKLESTTESLIAQIDECIITPDYLLILDKNGVKGVLVYDRKGNFINKIGKIGRGPGEYLEVADFEVKDQSVYLYADDDKKIIEFQFDGTLKNEIKISKFGNALHKSTKDEFITINSGSLYGLDVWSSGGKLLKSYKDEDFTFIDWQLNKSISSTKDACYIMFPFNNILYSYRNKQLNNDYYFDFGDANFPMEKITNRYKFEKEVESNNYARVSSFSVSKSHIIFDVIFQGKVYKGLYNRLKKKSNIYALILTNNIPIANIVGNTDSGFISYLEPYSIEKSNTDVSYLKDISIDSNPVLVIFNSKK